MSRSTLNPTGLAFGGAIALAVGQGIGRFAYTPILPPMAEALGLSRGEAGFIASANFLGYLLGALLASTPWLRGSRRGWMLAALTTSGATTAAMGLVSGLPVFLALRFIGGGASAVMLVLASTLVLDRLAVIGRPALGQLFFGGIGGGIAFSAAFVALMHGADIGWRGLWIGCGLISFASLPLVAWLVPMPPAELPVAPSMTPSGRPQRWPPGWRRLLWCYALFGLGYVVTATFIVAMVRESAETQPLEPFVWLLTGLVAAPSLLLWSRLGHRMGLSPALALACLVEAVGVAAAVVLPGKLGMLLSAIGLGGTMIGITALGLMAARELAANLSPDHRRRGVGLMTAAFGVGQIIGPFVAGLLGDATGGFRVPVLCAAAVLLIASAMATAMPRRAGA